MAPTAKVIPFVLPLLVGSMVCVGNAQQTKPTKAVQLTGLTGVKNNTGGSLTVENGNLRFTHAKNTSDLPAASMQDVVTGSDSQRVIRGTLGTISMFGPYGSDRFLSLFRSKIDTLTIQYRDADGALHGVIFTSPVGTAEVTKDELVGLGARTSIPTQGASAADKPDHPDKKDTADQTQAGKLPKINASAIRVMMIQSDEVKLPAEFQVSLYENLIQQLEKKGGFQHVYREGDRNSDGAPISSSSVAPCAASSRAVKWPGRSPRSAGRLPSACSANLWIRMDRCCWRAKSTAKCGFSARI